MIRVNKFCLPVFILFFLGCVTVNVNFPEGAVQRAADDYVKELYKARQEDEKQTAEKEKKSSSLFSFSLGNVAYAQAEFKVDSPKAKEIQGRQKSRLSEVTDLLANGQIGEGADGLLEVKASDAKPLLMKKIEKVVKEENSDRKDLYDEVAKTNNISSSAKDQVQSSFAKSFQSAAPKGAWVEAKKGSWNKK